MMWNGDTFSSHYGAMNTCRNGPISPTNWPRHSITSRKALLTLLSGSTSSHSDMQLSGERNVSRERRFKQPQGWAFIACRGSCGTYGITIPRKSRHTESSHSQPSKEIFNKLKTN